MRRVDVKEVSKDARLIEPHNSEWELSLLHRSQGAVESTVREFPGLEFLDKSSQCKIAHRSSKFTYESSLYDSVNEQLKVTLNCFRNILLQQVLELEVIFNVSIVSASS